MKRRKELADKENRTCKYPVSFFPKTPKNEWIHEKQLLTFILKFIYILLVVVPDEDSLRICRLIWAMKIYWQLQKGPESYEELVNI